ncbi:MAG: HPr family phosphocarrier protein [Treponema sp.]|jgi:phosphocarrier protein|nr:HPr family phosphocarrier protein [Treponema sp.]
MTEKTITVSNRAGIHARPSALLVETSKNYNCNIYFERGNDRINAKSIMGVLTLAAAYGTEIRIIAEGEDTNEEIEAVEALIKLFASKFEEEQDTVI